MTNNKACLPAGRHKIQNKSLPVRQAGKTQIPNDKTFVLVFVI